MPEGRTVGSHVSADLPIKSREQDKLNRGGFAEALANIIKSWRDKPSLVIGLFGDWGSGKSSLKNLVIEIIRRDRESSPQVVEFSPWQVSSQDILSETFFREIGKALGKTAPPEDIVLKRRVARWKMYSSVLSISATVARAFRSALPPTDPMGLAIAGVAMSAEGAASVAKTGSDAIEAEGTADSLSLSELKDEIGEDLKSLDRPILVVIDDIDRLTKEEIRHTLQLVKANADFPNIIYLLLAQRKSVLAALEEIAPDEPDAYLEKIIQVSFDVPVVNRKQLQDFFLNGLNELLAGPQLDKRFSAEHWGAVFPHLFPLFQNLRDLNRFLGTLAFHIQLFLNGDTFEVNPVDLIALEAIRLFEPGVYRKITEAKDILTDLGTSNPWGREKDAETRKQRVQEILSLSSEGNRDSIRNILGVMFPPSNLGEGFRIQGRDAEDRWFQQLRVCSYQTFDRYFQFATPEGDVSQADIENLIACMGDLAKLDRIFLRLNERGLLEVMLTRIASLETSVPLDHAATLLAGLYQIKFEKREYGLFETSPKDRIASITYWYLQRLPENERLKVMEEALRITRGISLAIRAVELLTHVFDASSTSQPFFQDQAMRDRLNKAGVEAILRATEPGSQVSPDEALLSVDFWARFDNASAKAWLDAYLKDRHSVARYLESIISRAEGTGGSRRFIFVASFEPLFSVEELEAKVDQYLDGELTPYEAGLLRLFKKGVQTRREGKDDPYHVWAQRDADA
jgi:hypothetical protein